MRKEFMIIASIVAATFANDARINALGGSSMFDDASFIYYNPAYVTEYQIIQGNVTAFSTDVDEDGDGTTDYTDYEEVMGAGIATWHLNENIVLGGYFDQNREVAPLFNNDKYNYVAEERKPSPHLLFGFKISDDFSIGFDGGLEINKYSDKEGAIENMTKSRVLYAGLGANLSAGSLDLDISADLALPASKATEKTATTDTTTKDVSGLSLGVDAYATFELDSDLDFTAGAGFSTHKIEDAKAPDNTSHPKELNLSVIAGVAKEFEFDMTLGLEAEFGLNKSSNTENDSTTTNTGVLFIAAAEKTFGQTKLFDTHSFRVGYGHAFAKSSEVVDNGDGNDNTEKKNNGSWMDLEGNSDVGLSAGFGITRGKFGLDLYVSQVNFDFNSNEAGIWDVLPVAGATMTIDFAKKGSPLRGKKAEAKEAGNTEW